MQAAISYAIPFVCGALILVWGQVVIYLTMRNLWAKQGIRGGTRKGETVSAIIGAVEGVMYLGAFIFNKPEFIALWLGLKTAVKWRHWEYDVPVPIKGHKKPAWILGRIAYNLFLIGNGLVILVAATAWKTVQFVRLDVTPKLYALLTGILLVSVVLICASSLVPLDPPLRDSDPRVKKPPKA